nr:MAG TPA: hypothetical protein [Caudoviricetes sp.]DAT92874.1 MAG TPA: hypothetical protein [Bacteriophage sp.]
MCYNHHYETHQFISVITEKGQVKSMLFPTEKYCVYVHEYKRRRFGRIEYVCQHYRSLPNR